MKLYALLVWLSGLSDGFRTKRSPVRFPARAHSGLQARSAVGGVSDASLSH